MAFFRRSSSVLRSTLTRVYGKEQPHQLTCLSKDTMPFLGARFMCSIPSTKLFVGGLSWGMDDNSLRDTFQEFGEVAEAKVVVDRETGRSKGFGFVSFTCTDHASAALNAMNGKLHNGRSLRVNFAIEKQRGFGGFGGYGGGGEGGFGGGDSNVTSPSGEASYGNSGGGSFDQGSSNASSSSGAFNDDAGEERDLNFFGDDAFGDLENNDSNQDVAQGYK